MDLLAAHRGTAVRVADLARSDPRQGPVGPVGVRSSGEDGSSGDIYHAHRANKVTIGKIPVPHGDLKS